MRIHVLFADATSSVLVPCGDGKITIMELITRARIRFRKIQADKVSLKCNMRPITREREQREVRVRVSERERE